MTKKSVIDQVKQAASDEINKLSEELARERDELRLQLHLLSAEAKEEWHEIEGSLKQFTQQASDVGSSIEKMSHDGLDTVKKMGTSLKEAFKKMRAKL